MGELGSTLRQAREALGLSLEQVQEATKIRGPYLQALEEEAFEALPAAVYVRGFLKNYAQFLGLDPQEVLALYQGTQPTEAPSSATPMLDEPLDPFTLRRWWPVALIPVILTAAAIAMWGYQRYYGAASIALPTQTPTSRPTHTSIPSSPTVPQQTLTPVPTETAAPSATVTPSPTRLALVLRVEVVGSRSWLLVLADGQRVFAGILEPGAVQTWSARERISLRSGDAGAVQVRLNGEDLGLFGEVGEVVEKEWTAPGVPTSTPVVTPET